MKRPVALVFSFKAIFALIFLNFISSNSEARSIGPGVTLYLEDNGFRVSTNEWAVDKAQALAGGKLVTSSVATCVALAARDPNTGLLALAHLLYRETDQEREQSEMIENVKQMVQQIRVSGVDPKQMIWSVIGAAEYPQSEHPRMRNNDFGWRVIGALENQLQMGNGIGIHWEFQLLGGDNLVRTVVVTPDKVFVTNRRLQQELL